MQFHNSKLNIHRLSLFQSPWAMLLSGKSELFFFKAKQKYLLADYLKQSWHGVTYIHTAVLNQPSHKPNYLKMFK